jgi:hypothetical protein
MAAELLRSHGLRARAVQDYLAKMAGIQAQARRKAFGTKHLWGFLVGLKSLTSGELLAFFRKTANLSMPRGSCGIARNSRTVSRLSLPRTPNETRRLPSSQSSPTRAKCSSPPCCGKTRCSPANNAPGCIA